MKRNDISIGQLKEAISVLENPDRAPQKLSEILPLALVALKSMLSDMERAGNREKFYSPVWVNELLGRLSSGEKPLDELEYHLFKSLAQNLSADDYKSAQSGLMGYQPQYITPQEISESILALKHYFRLL